MNEFKIQNKLKFIKPMRNHDYICPNVYVFNWESDLLSCTKAGYIHECEIKISKSDFKSDFKNKTDKHCILRNGYRTTKNWETYHANKDNKIKKNRPNYFWYVCPEKLIHKNSVPSYAGLIYMDENYLASIIKKAPLLHKEKITVGQRDHILRSFQFRYWDFRLSKARNG